VLASRWLNVCELTSRSVEADGAGQVADLAPRVEESSPGGSACCNVSTIARLRHRVSGNAGAAGGSGKERPRESLIELLKIRASQINKCAFCLHMHMRDARKAGETEERIYLLDAWRESSLYSERERAALAWTEALTLLPEQGAPDEVYAEMKAQFSDAEIVNVTLAIGAMNAWNRIGVGFALQHPSSVTKTVAA
jgi:AhpD family alkylhydroperoxidase